MHVPFSWLREYVDLPDSMTATDLAARLTELGLKLEAVHPAGAGVAGPLVVGRVLSYDDETHPNAKTIRWCTVDVGPVHAGEGGPRGVVCGATNFGAGDLVVVALPGTVLPGGFQISARRAYGHLSDGMICSPRELGVGDEAGGILVLRPDEARPGDDAVRLLGLRDEVIELEINPDRAYALSLRGVARESALATGATFHDPADVSVIGEGPGYPVEIKDPTACSQFVARTVVGFNPAAPTPRWLARRLQLAGMRPIGLAVDVTNYVMLETGQPIHGYDRDRLAGPISVRRAEPGERVRTLDGVERVLDADDVVIADDRGAIGLAGVMGGQETEIGPDTAAVVIEAACFAPVPIARTARRLRLGSEASKRFERGVDPQLPARAAQRVADLLVAFGGGRLEPGRTDCGEPPPTTVIGLPPGLAGEVCGVSIDAATVTRTLRQVGCAVDAAEAGGELAVTVPSWRPDLRDPYDLVEEVIRVVGYDKVPSLLPTAPAGRGLTSEQRLRRRVGQALAGAGFVEVVAYPFVGAEDWDRLGIDAQDPRRRTLRVTNPLAETRAELTTTLAPLLFDVAARNVSRGFTSLALSLVAPVFLPGASRPPAPVLPVDRAPAPAELAALDAALPAQPRRLAVALTGEREPAGWWGAGRDTQWADAIAAVRLVADVLQVSVDVAPDATPPWHPGRCAQVLLDGSAVGHAGELHPRVCTAWGLPMRTSYAEVDLDALIDAAPALAEAPRFSAMPVAKEDVALVVSVDVPAAKVLDALRRGGGELLESVRLFDLYTGEPVPEGHKSLAFSLRLRAADRTLTEADAAAVRDAAVAEAARATGARLRS